MIVPLGSIYNYFCRSSLLVPLRGKLLVNDASMVGLIIQIQSVGREEGPSAERIDKLLSAEGLEFLQKDLTCQMTGLHFLLHLVL